MKYGILGGTFNPIHNGHLLISREVRSILDLDKIIFIPAKVPPLKPGAALFNPDQRMKMVKAAIDSTAYAQISEVDFRREGPSYSVNTLIDIAAELKSLPKDLFFIVGVDAFLDIKKWWQFERLFELANFVVVTRIGFDSKLGEIITIAEELGFSYNKVEGAELESSEKLKGVAHQHTGNTNSSFNSANTKFEPRSSTNKDHPKLTENISEKNTSSENTENLRFFTAEGVNNTGRREILPHMIDVLTNKSGLNLFIIEVTPLDVSSSEIRRRIGENKSILGMVPDAVLHLIKEELIA
jgi:nicotinate-nucleotide adenylyltransferase